MSPVVTPLARSILTISGNQQQAVVVKVTQWGSSLEDAKHVVFYFGGMPASAEEPALHSCRTSSSATGNDVYASRKIHLVCIDKPGMGGSSFQYRFSIQKDWPRILDSVASQLEIQDQYGVVGVSNGGPYVMASLLDKKSRVKAAAMVVGVSNDVWKSGYFASKLSTMFEGIYNSLPLVVTAPLNAIGLFMGSFYLMQLGGFESVLKGMLPPEAKPILKRVLSDGAANFGLGAALDCQQGLSLLYARDEKTEYHQVKAPVSLWYGKKDKMVPMASAEWLHQQLPNSVLHKVDAGHELYFTHMDQVLDELVAMMDEVDSQE
ncbi:Alpha beta hydrolase [Fragilaria crotonensis]|nr:Alpha beta hydrolase [Fragilaria crotonensis]